jgi:hypothetical protein
VASVNRLSRFTLGLWAMVFGCVALSVAIRVSPWYHDTTLNHTLATLKLKSGEDSWRPMRNALDHLATNPEQPSYQIVFFETYDKFQYPPACLLPLELLRHSPFGDLTSNAALNALALLSLFGTALAGIALVRHGTAQAGRFETKSRVDAIARVVAVVALSLTFFPLIKSFTVGQAQTFINFLTALLLLAWVRDKPKLGGVALGLICVIKPTYGAVFLWAAVRRRWAFMISGLATIGVLSLIAVFRYGWDFSLDYLRVLDFMSDKGKTFHANQSVNGLLNRMLHLESSLDFVGDGYAPSNALVRGATVISSLVMLVMALAWRWRSRSAGGATDLAVVFLVVTIASPIAWDHHFGVMFPILALATVPMLEARVFGGATGAVLAVAYVLVSQTLVSLTARAAESALNIVQSSLFFGAMAFLVGLFLVRAWEDRQETTESVAAES